MKKIFNSFKTSKRYSIKWNNYFEIYEKLLSKFKNKKITIVEVGVGDGGSLYMWKSFFGKKSRVIGIELNPDSKKLKKDGFEIFIGDQSDKEFWRKFYKQVGKIDVLIDDGGHTNIQQITTLVESIKFIKDNGLIIIEDTHTSFMKKKGFRNPSKYSLINFSTKIIESMHRRNPSIKKSLNIFSNRIFAIEYFDSLVVFKINKKQCKKSFNLENNKKLRNLFSDYRYKKGEYDNAISILNSIKADNELMQINIDKQVFNITLEKENYEEAAILGDAIVEKMFITLGIDELEIARTCYNVAFCNYQIGSNKHQKALETLNNATKDENQRQEALSMAEEAIEYYTLAKGRFYDSSSYNPNDTNSSNKAKELNKSIKQIKEIIIPGLSK